MRLHYYKKYLEQLEHAKHKNIVVKPNLATIVATSFFVGLIPIAPGTFGSLVGVVLAYPILKFLPLDSAIFTLYVLLIAISCVGFWATSVYQKQTRSYDHKSIVVDEVIGQLLTIALSVKWLLYTYYALNLDKIVNSEIGILLISLIGFRFFDIKKPFGIRYVERYFKNTFGVIIDDVLAAIFASVVFYVLYLIVRFV